MVLGMSLSTFTAVHVLISLVGILTGVVVAYGLLYGKRLDGMTAVFLATTVLTSATGYLFPFHQITPGMIVGAISLAVLAIAVVARYVRRMERSWRATYVITALLALYLNVFVLVVQSFEKVPSLRELAPTQKEPPFKVVQLVLLAIFVTLSFFAVRRFRNPVEVAVTEWTAKKAS